MIFPTKFPLQQCMSLKFKKTLLIKDNLSWEVILAGPWKFGVSQCLVRRFRNLLTWVLVSNLKRFKLKSPVNVTFLLPLATLFKALFSYSMKLFSFCLDVCSLHQTKCFVLSVSFQSNEFQIHCTDFETFN